MRSDPLVSTRYDLRTIWFHWAVAILVLIQWGIAQVIDLFPAGMPRVEARSVHISLGLCLGVLLAVRIFWRAKWGLVLPPADKGLLQTLAKTVHYALYALLIVMVLVGIFLVYVRGDNFFGLFSVPAFDLNNKALRDKVGDLHGTIATIFLILAGLHASAGLIHHYLWHDGVLRRMLPGAN